MTDHERGIEAAITDPAEYRRIHDIAAAAYEAAVPVDYRYSAPAVRKAVDAAIYASKPVAEAVKVKPLEWTCSNEWVAGEFVAEWFVYSVSGRYGVWCDPTVNPSLWHVSYPPGSEQPYEGTEHTSIDEAKAAAQSNYEQRIMSALSTPPQPEAQGDKGGEWVMVPKNPTEAMIKAGESWSGLPSALSGGEDGK